MKLKPRTTGNPFSGKEPITMMFENTIDGTKSQAKKHMGIQR
jgi:hypothetical protein